MIRVAAIASLAGLLVVGSLTAVIVSKNAEERGLRARLETADAAVAKARACDTALTAADLFAIEARCSAEVKHTVAERDARAAEAANLKTLLDQVRQGQAAAIARAETRGRSQTARTQNAQSRLDAAPRTDDGLGLCDADCLSRLGAP